MDWFVAGVENISTPLWVVSTPLRIDSTPSEFFFDPLRVFLRPPMGSFDLFLIFHLPLDVIRRHLTVYGFRSIVMAVFKPHCTGTSA
jgi:hypothetical protein